jgi:hypothetical protein
VAPASGQARPSSIYIYITGIACVTLWVIWSHRRDGDIKRLMPAGSILVVLNSDAELVDAFGQGPREVDGPEPFVFIDGETVGNVIAALIKAFSEHLNLVGMFKGDPGGHFKCCF